MFKITCQEKICRKLNICTSIPGTWYIVFVRIPRANAKTLGEIVLAVHSTRTPNQLLPCTLLLYCCCCCCFTPARALDALRLLPPCTLLCCAMKHTDIGGLQYPGSLRMVCHCCRRVLRTDRLACCRAQARCVRTAMAAGRALLDRK